MRKIILGFLSLQLMLISANVKVANALQTEDNKYAVISNESLNEESSESTGSFDIENHTLDKSLPSKSYRMDGNIPFDPSTISEKSFQRRMSVISPTYVVGSSKTFWVTDMTTEADYQINARLASSGAKANVWVHNNHITDADAAKLANEFDTKIYPSVTNYFAKESDVDRDGKINILCYDIYDGYAGYGGYYGGYFYSRDLYNVPHSNQSEIFYIDTYPTMGEGSIKNVTKAYGTLAHEFQHMVNFNQNVLSEKNDYMPTWLDEGLAEAAEQVYEGRPLISRLQYYNASESITNGHSLLKWEDNGDSLSNYSLSYLFMQYIKIQTKQGDAIFKEILQDPNNDYKAIENVAKKYISPDMTFGKLMTSFRIALLLKEPTGLYGFLGDSFYDALEEKIYTGSSANLVGGGAVVTSFHTDEDFVVPVSKGENITYTFLDRNVGDGQVDTTPPMIPTVNGISDVDDKITGKAEPLTTIIAMTGQKELGRSISGVSGEFTIAIPKQLGGTVINIFAMDAAGNNSKATSTTVSKTKLSGWVQENGVWYYYDQTTGAKKTGWNNVGGVWYFFDQYGAMQTGWLKQGSTWYYLKSNGGMQTGWLQSGSTWYYFKSNGAMQTGWLQSGSTWYYFKSSGAMQTGWLQSGTNWYYLKSNGTMQTGWLQQGTTWYYFQNNGLMHKGWLKFGVNWYYMKSGGAMQTGWANISGGWYFFRSNGVLK